ncbi:phosphonate ABC transporter, permease protein PhnE [Siculibacillus lacustris]|uniref:Phosphonate ABC transporter, permease protein PhnE n=1 Tax=Siculibacillus lacustris TaxID=1549641 RepID=A0A4Q9VRC8_9HYPH|nr:phosphonate ABC transporter, permease protein PhnE [Siculibacillus lacustris]TBW37587.1 phosphonate ABC transporter, permease protein PhnE [Siculibacillus lacustris]
MPTALPRLSDDRLRPLAAAYATSLAAARTRIWIGAGGIVALVLVSGWFAEVDLVRMFGRIGTFTDYIGRIFVFDNGDNVGRFVLVAPGEWMWGLAHWSKLILETLLIAYSGTILGAIGGFVLSFMSARNLGRAPLMRGGVKRLLEICRTVPELVFALVFVIAFGLGALPGVLAIAIHTTGALGKLFAEVVENIDMKPVEGTTAAGGSWWQTVRFAVVPQVLSNFASYTLLRFEINVRGASVMGFVGAGGIGQDLIEAIRKFYYADVSAILVLIILTVMVIDLGTERLRHRFIAREAHA